MPCSMMSFCCLMTSYCSGWSNWTPEDTVESRELTLSLREERFSWSFPSALSPSAGRSWPAEQHSLDFLFWWYRWLKQIAVLSYQGWPAGWGWRTCLCSIPPCTSKWTPDTPALSFLNSAPANKSLTDQLWINYYTLTVWFGEIFTAVNHALVFWLEKFVLIYNYFLNAVLGHC